LRIKLLFVIFSLEKGGAEKIFSFLANNLDLSKFEIYFLTIKQSDKDEFVLNENIHHIKLNHSRVLFSMLNVYRAIRSIRPNVIISTLIPVNIIIGLFIKLKLLKHTICILRESSIPSVNGNFSKQKFFFYNFLISKLYKGFDAIVAQSQDMNTDLVSNYKINKDKVYVINNPFFQNFQGSQSNTLSNKSPDKKIIINIGNLREEKGHLRLLDAVAGLKGKVNFELWILGSGVMHDQIKQRIAVLGLENEVKLLGHKPNVFSFLSQADVLVQTSFYEGFPNVLLEALGLGIPVVAYDVLGGTKEIIINEFNGFLVSDDNIKCFQEAVLTTLFLPFDKQAIINNIETRFSAKAVISKYEKLILNLHNLKYNPSCAVLQDT
jgi:glycosyltransferase involved in cell wall biosynthesis